MKIVLLVGLPGSGKSTYAAKLGVKAVSSDELRMQLADDITTQTIHRRVFAASRYLVMQRIRIGRPLTLVDATNLTARDRRPYVRLAQLHACAIEAVVFDIPLEVCLERNRTRSRVVPEEAVREMAQRFVWPVPEEGFSSIEIVRWAGENLSRV